MANIVLAAGDTSQAASVVASRPPAPMMFSDIVGMAGHLLGVPFSGWVVLILLASLGTWLAYAIARKASLIFVLPLIAVLLIQFESSMLARSTTAFILAVVLGGVGGAMYGRLARQ